MNSFQKTVYCTLDYDSLKDYSFNRDASIHGPSIKKEIEKKNMLIDNPLKCRLEPDGHIYIIDGGGRKWAAKQIGNIPIYYEFVESTLPALELITQYNSTSRKWNTKNYIHAHAKSSPSYALLDKILKENPSLDTNFVARYIAAPGGAILDKRFKEGKYKAVSSLSQKRENRLKAIGELTTYYKKLCKKHGVIIGGTRIANVKVDQFLPDKNSFPDMVEYRLKLQKIVTAQKIEKAIIKG